MSVLDFMVLIKDIFYSNSPPPPAQTAQCRDRKHCQTASLVLSKVKKTEVKAGDQDVKSV